MQSHLSCGKKVIQPQPKYKTRNLKTGLIEKLKSKFKEKIAQRN